MTCFICGASAPVIYLKGMFRQSDFAEQRAYCHGCFTLDDFSEEIRRTFHDFEIRVDPVIVPAPVSQPVPPRPSIPVPAKVCCDCGGARTTVWTGMLVGNVYENRDFCEACFGIAIGRIQRQSSLWHPQEEATINIPFQQLKAKWEECIHRICRNNPRFSPEAFAFVLKATIGTLENSAIPSELGSDQVSARALMDAVACYASETWGGSARDLLNLWGIANSSDVGEIVFVLSQAGLLRRYAGYPPTEFDDLPFL